MESSEKLGLITQYGEVAKLGAVLVGVAYGIGVVISNGYLAGLGIVDFSLLRPQAVLSGLWFLVFFAVGIVAEDSIQRAFTLEGVSRAHRVGNALFALGGAWSFYYMALLICRWGLVSKPSVALTSTYISLLMFFCVGSAITQAQFASKEWKRRTSDKKVGPSSAAFFIFHCTFLCAMVVWFGALFVTRFYCYVPQEFGGARPRQVQIAVTDNEALILRRVSVPITNNVLDDPVKMVHEGTGDVVILSKTGSVVTLPRREILAIRIK